MDEKQRDIAELNRLHDEWLEIKKRKLGKQIEKLNRQAEDIMTEYVNGIVEMYKLAFEEDIIVQNKEYFSDTKEMLISMYAPAGIYEEKAVAFADAFNQKFGTKLVPEIYSDNEFAFNAKM